MNRAAKANLMLLLVTALWGMTFPLVHMAVQVITPALFVLLRFALAAILFIPLIIHHSFKEYRLVFLAGLIIGILSGLSYLFQTIGLVTIPVSRSAFITGMSVVLVPLLLPLFGLGKPKPLDYVSVILCLLGIYILTGASFKSLSIGDLWTFLSALSYSCALIAIQVYSAKYKQTQLLAFYQILFTLPLAAVFMPAMTWHLVLSKQVLIPILYCSILATCLVFYLQMRYQKDTTATKAVLIFALEPIFATLFSYLFWHEPLTRPIIIGGIIILISTILSDIGVYTRST